MQVLRNVIQGYIYYMYTYSKHMGQLFMRAPKLEYARRGANPTLETMEYVIKILQKSEEPISRYRILSILKSWGHSTTGQTLNVALAFLGDKAMVAEGSKGLIWVPEASPKLLDIIRSG